MEKKSQFGILLTGAVIGAAGVFLLAPQSGRKTREWLGEQTQWAGQKFGEMAEKIARQAGQKAEPEVQASRRAFQNRFDSVPVLNDESSTGRVAWVLVGTLAAAAAALLLAPQSGKETRQWLADQVRTGRDRLKEAGARVQDYAQKKTQVREPVMESAHVEGNTAQRIADTESGISRRAS
jgi:gas vesicle protein